MLRVVILQEENTGMKKNAFILIALILMPVVVLLAQENESATAVEKEKTQFKIGIYHNTGLNFYGRTDSLRSSGSFPMAELWLTKNFYIYAAPVFINNSAATMQYAGTVTTAGYQFHSDNKLSGNFYFVKPFYKESSQLVQSALKAQGAFTLTALNKILNVTGGGDVKFSDKVDVGLTAGLDHIFRKQFADQSILVVDPSFYVYAGTQQFTNTYYKQSNFIFFPGVQQQITEDVKRFNILSYEFSMPVVFAKGKFQFLAIPAYVMPQNLIKVENRPDLSERGRNMFYATAGAKIAF
jgi:hypothetical protein